MVVPGVDTPEAATTRQDQRRESAVAYVQFARSTGGELVGEVCRREVVAGCQQGEGAALLFRASYVAQVRGDRVQVQGGEVVLFQTESDQRCTAGQHHGLDT